MRSAVDEPVHWAPSAAAAVLAAAAAYLTYHLVNLHSSFVELVPGIVSFLDQAKNTDYAMLAALIGGFALAYIVLSATQGRLRRHCGPVAVESFQRLLGLGVLPTVVWLGSLVISPDVHSDLLYGSAILIGVFSCISIAVALGNSKLENPERYTPQSLEAACLSPVFAGFSWLAGVIATRQVASSSPSLSVSAFWIGAICTAAIAITAVCFLSWRTPTEHSSRRWQNLLLVCQIPLPLLFLVLIPLRWEESGRIFTGYPMSLALCALVAGCIGFTYFDLFRRWRRDNSPVLAGISPLCVLAILIALKLTRSGVPFVSSDDYHSGEMLLPWWLTKQFGTIPFWDYAPSRGLVNYVYTCVGSIFFDGTAASFIPATPIVSFIYTTLAFTVFRRGFGGVIAFVVCLLFPPVNSISEIDLVITAGLCFLAETLGRVTSTRWLVQWIISGLLAVLFAPGQGGLLVIATMPLGMLTLLRAWQTERRKAILAVSITVVSIGALALCSPLGRMLAGAIRYGIEQSDVNTVANGIAWSSSWKSFAGANPLVWEIARSCWIAVALISVVVVVRTWAGNAPTRQRILAYAIPIVLMTVLYVLRAPVRIDPNHVSRLGLASAWAFAALLPILLGTVVTPRNIPFVLMLAGFGSGVLMPSLQPQLLKYEDGLLHHTQTAPVTIAGLTSGSQIGIPNLGLAVIDPQQLRRLKSLQDILSKGLRPGETYLDLTNRNAQTYYLGYRPPMEVGAFYNLPSESMQLRAIGQLDRTNPPVVLISANNLVLDELSVSLRAHLLFRYVLARYQAVQVGEFIFMVKPERKLEFVRACGGLNGDGTALLDAVFRATDLGHTPQAWGRSFPRLYRHLGKIADLSELKPVGFHSLTANGNNHFEVTGADPYVSFDISALKLSGDQAGILSFDLDFPGLDDQTEVQLEIYWSAEDAAPTEATVVRCKTSQGHLLVPLDANPRWLLAPRLSSLRIDIADPAPCKTFRIRNLMLLQRDSVSSLPKIKS